MTAPGCRAVVVDTTDSPYARLKPVPVSAVKLVDSLLAPRCRTNVLTTLPGQFRHLEATGRLRNFDRASGRTEGGFEGLCFNDSDVYKWMEAAAWVLASGWSPDPAVRSAQEELDARLRETAERVAAAQEADGYLNTYFTGSRKAERWTNLKDLHELYCAGHFFQAAVAHRRAGGEEALVSARRFADLLVARFGPKEEGRTPGVPGHEEVETALVELYRATGERRYLDLAAYFVGARGRGLVGGGGYHQDHAPLVEQREAVGHAVRATYLYAGAADLAAETGDPALRGALEALWASATGRRMYVTGGVGARYGDEAFGRDHELPNDRAYAETCAAIGLLFWAWRMLQLDGDAKYADTMERALYNAVLAGVSLDGARYFYQNPLEDDGSHRREAWFGCSCCPPNVARLLASLPGYVYSRSRRGVWVHLYAMSSAAIDVEGGPVVVNQYTNYPWEGTVKLEIDGEGEFSLFLRIPGWCRPEVSLAVNGEALPAPHPGGYAEVRRRWRSGDAVEMTFPMPVERLAAHPRVSANAGRVALARGPLVYCLEAADNRGIDPRDVVLPREEVLSAAFRPDLLGGVVALSGHARVVDPGPAWNNRLYRPLSDPPPGAVRRTAITAIPYHAWANRDPGPMQVWVKSG